MQCIIVIFVFDNSLHWNSICVQISVGRAVYDSVKKRVAIDREF